MAPAPHFCRHRQQLLEQFISAVHEHINLQNAQLAALIQGKGFSLEQEIGEARERRDQAKYAVLEHDELHACAAFSPVFLKAAAGRSTRIFAIRFPPNS